VDAGSAGAPGVLGSWIGFGLFSQGGGAEVVAPLACSSALQNLCRRPAAVESIAQPPLKITEISSIQRAAADVLRTHSRAPFGGAAETVSKGLSWVGRKRRANHIEK